MEAHFHYRVWQQEPWQMRLWRRIRFIYFLSHAENTYQGGLKSWRSLFWHAQIREERAWAESRGRNVSNNTMQRQKREKNRGAGFFFFLQLTIPQSAGISSDLKIYSKPDWQRRPMPCTEIRVYTRYPSKTLRKTISLSPPSKLSTSRHQVSSKAQNTAQCSPNSALVNSTESLQLPRTWDEF